MSLVVNAWRVLRAGAIASAALTLVGAQACSSGAPLEAEQISTITERLSRSANPPGGLSIAQVPQFVAVTFDDNFRDEGMRWANDYYRPLRNPAGSGNAATFDNAPVRTTFYHNSMYLSGMQARWKTALDDGHEAADHTVSHNMGGLDRSVTDWRSEIENCRTQLKDGLSTTLDKITGFRAPFLHYNDNTFTALRTANPAFAYDSSIQSCWANSEDGTNCPWPYTLDSGSADADTIFTKFAGRNVRQVGQHAGLWELPIATAIVPPDSLAAQYMFPSGLRNRIQTRLGSANNPNFFEQSSGKLVSMDISMLLDAQMSKAEALATLKYTLDLHLQGNRSPLIFVAHTHVYEPGWNDSAPNVQDLAQRRAIITEFIEYALSKPVVRMVPVRDILKWMNNPQPLGSCTPQCSGKQCGPDGCGGSCGSCSGTQTCSASGQCQSCVPQCTGKECGADGCGGTCGACGTNEACDAAGQCVSSAGNCNAPTWTAKSYAAGEVVTATCLAATPGTACAGKLNVKFAWRCDNVGWCGTLRPGGNDAGWWSAWTMLEECSGTCTPTTCAAQGKNCGTVSNGCGGTLNCGSCSSGQSCNNNVCTDTCTPTTCAAQGKNCGTISNGCGGTLNCGSCSSGQSCNNNVCTESCIPTTCAALGKNCGVISDGCGGALNCGSCSSGQSCSANVCQGSSSCSPSVSSYTLGKCNATAVYNGKLYKCISQAAGVNGEASGCGTPGVYCSSIQPDNAAWGTSAWQFVQNCN